MGCFDIERLCTRRVVGGGGFMGVIITPLWDTSWPKILHLRWYWKSPWKSAWNHEKSHQFPPRYPRTPKSLSKIYMNGNGFFAQQFKFALFTFLRFHSLAHFIAFIFISAMNNTQELITLQFGNFANHVGCHFWNTQVSKASNSHKTLCQFSGSRF